MWHLRPVGSVFTERSLIGEDLRTAGTYQIGKYSGFYASSMGANITFLDCHVEVKRQSPNPTKTSNREPHWDGQ